MTPRESADEHAALDATFYAARESGRRCNWYMDRGYAKGRPCGNDAKLLPLGDAFFCPVPLGGPGDLLFGQEGWRSWQEPCDALDAHICDAHCNQTYVAYSATPRVGYRPIPDKARITYLVWNPDLLGPWEPAETMPEWAARVRLVNRGVRVERVGDVWTWCVAVERAGGGQ